MRGLGLVPAAPLGMRPLAVALFPAIPQGVASEANAAVLAGGDDAAFQAELLGKGVPARALSNPIFIDADGDGWRGQFNP